jgi:hypothetical protein
VPDNGRALKSISLMPDASRTAIWKDDDPKVGEGQYSNPALSAQLEKLRDDGSTYVLDVTFMDGREEQVPFTILSSKNEAKLNTKMSRFDPKTSDGAMQRSFMLEEFGLKNESAEMADLAVKRAPSIYDLKVIDMQMNEAVGNKGRVAALKRILSGKS